MSTVRSPARTGVPAQPGTERRMTFVLYEDNGLRWRWRLVSRRGDVLAESGRSYAREQKALEAVHSIQQSTAGARVEKRP